jgi:putative Ca2+/H+ antiporter (TMEM165/GDT1 family)
MNWQLFVQVFGTVFVAELGDKTQLAAMAFATKAENGKLVVFGAASAALVASTAIGVAAGQFVNTWVGEQTLRWIAGFAFIAIGLWTLLEG